MCGLEATEYDSCDEFVGKIGDTWFHRQFSRPDGDDNKCAIRHWHSYPLDRCVKRVTGWGCLMSGVLYLMMAM